MLFPFKPLEEDHLPFPAEGNLFSVEAVVFNTERGLSIMPR